LDEEAGGDAAHSEVGTGSGNPVPEIRFRKSGSGNPVPEIRFRKSGSGNPVPEIRFSNHPFQLLKTLSQMPLFLQ
jgi:hypothetical protein